MRGKGRRAGALLLALLVLLACRGAPADTAAGPDVAPEDIADFYYTVDSSAWPPRYQRYRFYMEDGQPRFFHDTRQGEDWPLTEADSVYSGTVALTRDQWAAFLDCLRDGRALPREEHTETGDEGPWTYLYPASGPAEGLAFSFASPGRRADFEALCRELAGNHVLTRLFFLRGGEMVPRTWEVTRTAAGCSLRVDEGEPLPLTPAQVEALETAAAGMAAWDGFRGSDPRVLDGESFSLTLAYADGTTVQASGENAFPEGYHEAAEALEAILRQVQRAPLAGTYRYEGEGLGGDFTLTLAADGTYTFYEGPLSSYLGGGTWEMWYGQVWLTEERGFDLSFSFLPAEDALVYLAESSDAFPYVTPADGARFIRTGEPAQDADNADSEEEVEPMALHMTIGGREVPVTWEENASVAALRALAPLTVQLSMYGGFEQVGAIGRALPREDRQTETGPGDIVLYSGDQLVVFYGHNAWAYTPLGHVDLSQEEMAALLGHGDVTLSLWTE